MTRKQTAILVASPAAPAFLSAFLWLFFDLKWWTADDAGIRGAVIIMFHALFVIVPLCVLGYLSDVWALSDLRSGSR